jgi:hypothetical protein
MQIAIMFQTLAIEHSLELAFVIILGKNITVRVMAAHPLAAVVLVVLVYVGIHVILATRGTEANV